MRLAWEIPLALILVLFGTMLSGHWLTKFNLHPKQKPVDVRVYELPPSPPSHGSQSLRHSHQVSGRTPAKKLPHHERYGTKKEVLRNRRSNAAPPSKPFHLLKGPKAHLQARKQIQPRRRRNNLLPSTSGHTAKSVAASREHRTLNWADLTAQINSTAENAAGRSAFLQVHDPHTLIARYYIAAILKALQRAGDMIYNGQQTGTVGVRMIIGIDGDVKFLRFDPWDGASDLVPMARSIVNVSAPFSPFPANLAHRTKRLKIEVLMRFLGNHDVSAE